MTLIGHIVGTKGNTGRGIASIVENADYTITINLTDGTSYTTAPIAGFTDVAFDENYDLVVTKTDGTTETVETDLGSYEDLLKGYKDDAETAATNAGNSATAASGYASNALSSENNASTYANNASGSATAASGSADSASASASSASTQALKSEGFALGEQNGSAVTSSSPYYHNNSKYFSQLSSASSTNASTSATNANTDALKAEGYAVGKQNGTSVSSDSPYYHHNAMYYNSQATNMASLATNKANSAGTDALKAEGFSVGEQNGTPVTSDSDYYENNAKYYAEQAETSAQSLVIEDALDEDSTNAVENGTITKEFAKKANVDGYYDTLGAGTAEQLVSNIIEEESEPYNFRTSGGSIDIGDRETDMLVGGTVAWNQLVQNGNFADGKDGWSINGTSSVSDGVVTWTTPSYYANFYRTVSIVSGHKYLAAVMINTILQTTCTLDNKTLWSYRTGSGIWQIFSGIISATGVSGENRIRLSCVSESASTDILVKYVCVFDLTQMFGSTIADYIYSLEQANAGAGVAFFRKLFPKPYYEYNAGELMSVQASSHDMVGFNAWDEEWEDGIWKTYSNGDGSKGPTAGYTRAKNLIRVLPNTTYFVLQGNVAQDFGIGAWDYDGNFLGYANRPTSRKISDGHWTFTTNSDTHYVSYYQKGNIEGLCINLSWDGERDGEYEPYKKHSYPLDSSLTLRGIPKLDANNNFYYDGDEYESDGNVQRRYGIVDLGTLTWIYDSQGFMRSTGISTIINKPSTSSVVANIISIISVDSAYNIYNGDNGIGIHSNGDIRVRINEMGTDPTAFKTAMSGVYLVYELATPTTETADTYTNPQIVDDFGTEEYVDYPYSQGTRDVAIPVGHYTEYMANLKAKLEMSPNSPDGAGDYIVRQTNGENEYVTLASNATIQDIIARLEALEGDTEGGGE